MSQRSRYLQETLRRGEEFTLYRGEHAAGSCVLARTPTARPPSPQSVGRLAHEYSLIEELDPIWAARPTAFIQEDGQSILLLNDCGGEPLDLLLERMQGKPMQMTRCLQLASNLAWALGQVHNQHLIHKDIKPANVLVEATDRVRLFGFGIASRLLRERQEVASPELIAGTLPYMAPEQTGRMNRSVDARSDLYSLGVTLYEMLTGALPFAASTPIEWIHCHIARQPHPPSELRSEIPPVLNAIVMKLLAKDPEERYQTAKGVEVDLRRCLSTWLLQARIDEFPIGEHDISDRLLIPEKLYGREPEINVLLQAFDRVVNRCTTELIMIKGYSGIGKSSIVNELHKVLVPSRGLFASGKYEQFKPGIPFSTLVQAFQGLVRQLLSKSEPEVEAWRNKLLAALGSNGQLMINLIPELELIIGEQPPIPRVELHDSAARFHLVFQSLLSVFARPEHPLVLFIDDMQWLDAATLDLLKRLVTEPNAIPCLLIGAYRDNETGPAHPLTNTLNEIASVGVIVSQITLAPLQVAQLVQLLSGALHADAERTAPLAGLVLEKTGGNPFFVIQFIGELVDEGLLRFDAGSATWQWTIDQIRAKGITDNVADLMATKIGRLSLETQEAIGQLACLGNVADMTVLALLRDVPVSRIQLILRDAVEAGLLLYDYKSFAFIHDRVHEAAYALVPLTERAVAHLRIASVLLSLTTSADLEERIFEIVHQFDRGAAALASNDERDLVAKLYLLAGKRAKSSSAHASALSYFSAGRLLLGEDCWELKYELTFELELSRAECEIVVGELTTAEDHLAVLLPKATSLTDQAHAVCLEVLLYFTTGRNAQAAEAALAFLSNVGVEWALHPTETQVRKEHLDMHNALSSRSMSTLAGQLEMTDPAHLATMAVLTELFPAAYAFDRYLLELVLLRMTNLSLIYGTCEGSSVAYSALNMALGNHFSDFATAYGLGQLACDLVDRRGMDRYKARVYCCFAAFAMPWIKHVSSCLPLLVDSIRGGSSMGDTAFAAYTWRVLLTHQIVSGIPLDQVQREAERAYAFSEKIQLGMSTGRFIRQLEFAQMLRGEPIRYNTADEEWAKQSTEDSPSLAMMILYYWVFRLQERFLAADIAAALDAMSHVEGRRWAFRSTLEEAEYDFYAALTHSASGDCDRLDQREKHVIALIDHYARIAAADENCHDNFDNRKALIGAEIARLEGRHMEAQSLYEEAVQLARGKGFVQNEAIANELAGKFYLTRGLITIADAYLRNARDCYERWGALVKVRMLDASYPHLRVQGLLLQSTETINKPIAHLDLETVGKASQTLSTEMVFPTLLEKLMRLTVEHAGAERGLLILLHGDTPYIEAEATTGQGSVEVALRSVRVTPLDLPQSALQYVLRSHDPLVIDDASVKGLDANDVYVNQYSLRSVLCLPIFKQTVVIGALYLENNLTTCAFTASRVAVLDFLASQAAIWLENARLYSNLRRSEAWLKEAQHLSSTGSFFWRVDQDTVEFSEQTFRTYELSLHQPVTLELIETRMHPEDLHLMRKMVQVARVSGANLDYSYRAQMPDLSIKHLHVVAHSTKNEDGQFEYIGSIQDVTQRHHSEEALGRIRSHLANVARVTGLGVLTASIAHEVNQPLSGIVTNASACLHMLTADPPNIEGARETARRMIRDAHRASDVIARLRALFAKQQAATESVDLNEAAKEVVILLASDFQRSHVILHTDFAYALPPVRGNRVQLQQVVQNLLRNGSESMNSVDDRPRNLLIRTERDGVDHVRLVIQDAGVGLEPLGVERLFEAFHTTKHGGAGIGLSISRSIIESHGGRLWATSNDGPGTSFSFAIPIGLSAVPNELSAITFRPSALTNGASKI